MSEFQIRSATLDDLHGYHACLASVAAERRHIGFTQAPSISDSEKWMQSVLESKLPFLVVARGPEILGWCDIGRREREGFRHTAELGMGLLLQVRGGGLGSRLLQHAMKAAIATEIEKIELQVYSSNKAARHLYEKFGFEYEGTRKRARKIDGSYDDILLMGKFLTDNQASDRTGNKGDR